jgi:hypothetical protein
MEKVVLIKIKSIYGGLYAYPANEAAELFAAIAGTKTLASPVLAYAERLGFAIKEVPAYSLEGVPA